MAVGHFRTTIGVKKNRGPEENRAKRAPVGRYRIRCGCMASVVQGNGIRDGRRRSRSKSEHIRRAAFKFVLGSVAAPILGGCRSYRRHAMVLTFIAWHGVRHESRILALAGKRSGRKDFHKHRIRKKASKSPEEKRRTARPEETSTSPEEKRAKRPRSCIMRAGRKRL